jgi:hypothetical protein
MKLKYKQYNIDSGIVLVYEDESIEFIPMLEDGSDLDFDNSEWSEVDDEGETEFELTKKDVQEVKDEIEDEVESKVEGLGKPDFDSSRDVVPQVNVEDVETPPTNVINFRIPTEGQE